MKVLCRKEKAGLHLVGKYCHRGGSCVSITLFEAAAGVDSGKIYLQKSMEFNGTELIDELRNIQVKYTFELCLEFICNYDGISKLARAQHGEESYYPRRTPKDSELDIKKNIEEQFDLLRIVDNEKYPAYFYMRGQKYILKIYKG